MSEPLITELNWPLHLHGACLQYLEQNTTPVGLGGALGPLSTREVLGLWLYHTKAVSSSPRSISLNCHRLPSPPHFSDLSREPRYLSFFLKTLSMSLSSW